MTDQSYYLELSLNQLNLTSNLLNYHTTNKFETTSPFTLPKTYYLVEYAEKIYGGGLTGQVSVGEILKASDAFTVLYSKWLAFSIYSEKLPGCPPI
jgi:hypothetical protein